jgi:hypothetical protein
MIMLFSREPLVYYLQRGARSAAEAAMHPEPEKESTTMGAVKLRRNFRPAGPARATQSSPVIPESLLPPFEHCPRLDEIQRPPPLGPPA